MAKQSAVRKSASADPMEKPAAEGVLSVIRGLGAKGDKGLDRLIHERMRLGIVSALAINESLTFGDLKEILETTDGNLSVHARKLEEAEYIKCIKYFDGRVPKTEFRLTPTGQQALERYLNHMETLAKAMKS